MKKREYKIINDTIEQLVSPNDPALGTFRERLKILIPRGVSERPNVLFIMGGESALTDKLLIRPFIAYGKRNDMVIICGEHRGYGRSVSGENQDFPRYVSVRAALADYHAIRQKYAERFSGEWIIHGRSYGGSLAVTYAHSYPEDGAALLCSSGVTDWNAMLPEYDTAVRENLGPELYERLRLHIGNLDPAEPFTENWYGRELIYAFVTGLCQYREYQKLLPLVSAMSKLPTGRFVGAIKRADVLFAEKSAAYYAESNKALTLSNSEACTCNYGWRVWRYQQAFEVGTFWAPSGERSIYRRSAADWKKESFKLFGREAEVFDNGIDWNVRAMVPELEIPMVYVRGGKDPWRRVGLEEGYPIKNGKLISIQNGFHCPDSYPDEGPAVISEVLKYINKED